MENSNGIEIIDPQQFLSKYIQQGFSLETLSKVTGIPQETLAKLSAHPTADINDISKQNLMYLHVFLMQLYCVSPQDSEYLCSLVDSLTEYFRLSRKAIANYVGLSQDELDKFLATPEAFNDKEKYTTQIMHLFTTFVRDMRFSVEQ